MSTRRIPGPALALLLALVATARADRESDAQKQVDLGMELVKSDNLPAACEAFRKATTLVPEAPNPYRLLGLAEARLGRCAEAVTHLDVFLKKVPASDRRYPEAVTIRDRCAAESRPRLGAVLVTSEPAGAEVRFDDEKAKPAGVTPLKQEGLREGAHVVFVSKVGHRRTQKSFKVEPGETTEVEVSLDEGEEATAPPTTTPPLAPVYSGPPAPSLIEFRSKQADDGPYRVRLDSAACDVPCFLPSRPASLRLAVSGRAAFERTLTIPPGLSVVTIQRASLNAYIWGAILGGVGLSGVSAGVAMMVVGDSTYDGNLFGAGIVTLLIMPGALVTGIILLATAGRNDAVLTPASGRPSARGLRLDGIRVAAGAQGGSLSLGFGF